MAKVLHFRNSHLLFSGTVFKISEVLGSRNRRYIRVIEKGHHGLFLVYWESRAQMEKHPESPRGCLALDECKILSPEFHFDRRSGSYNFPSVRGEHGGAVKLTKVKDVVKKTGWFGGPRESIDLELQFPSAEGYNNFCKMVLLPLLESVSRKNGSTPDSGKKSLKKNYKLLGELGRGAFSVVYRAKGLDSNEIVAVKVVKLGKLPMTERRKNIVYLNSEIAIMETLSSRTFRHPNIVRMLGHFTEGELSSRNLSVCITMEVADGGELFDRIIERDHYSERDARIIMKKLLGALEFMHGLGIVHRDLKPENMIFESKSENAEVKITDFGLALNVYARDCFASNVVGTSGYYAPEVLSLSYGPSCDIWSMGVILYILLVGYPPFNAKNAIEMRRLVTKGVYSFQYSEWEDVSSEAKQLVSAMLTVDPTKRLTAKDALNHLWFKVDDDDSIDKNSSARVSRLKVFNARRKFKGAAMAVLLGQRFNIPKRVENIKSSSPPMFFQKPEIVKIQESLRKFEGDQINMIKKSFERHSSGGSNSEEEEKVGVTNTEHFAHIMSELGYGSLPLSRLFSLFDQNCDGILEYNELLAGLALLEGTGEESLKLCFQLYDVDGSGDIDPGELEKIFRLVGYTTSNIQGDVAEDLAFAFDKIDVNNDGKISFDEFKAAVSSNEKLTRCFLSPQLSG